MTYTDIRALSIAFTILLVLAGLHVADVKIKAQDIVDQETIAWSAK